MNLKWLTFSAENGYPPAMFMLYNIYSGKYNGLGNMPNAPEKAWEWLNKSFDAGFVLAKRELGDCYRKGIIVDKDSGKAYAYYYDAMEDGDIPSIISLAEMFEDGDGVEKDFSKALEWFEKAHENGVKEADEFICYLKEQLDEKKSLWQKIKSKF